MSNSTTKASRKADEIEASDDHQSKRQRVSTENVPVITNIETDPLLHLLRHTPITSLKEPDAKLVTLSSNTTFKHIVTTLSNNHILSAPVYDATFETYIGFVDVVDVLARVLQVIEKKPPNWDDTRPLLEQKTELFDDHALDLVNLSKRDPLAVVYSNQSLYDAMAELAVKGRHRVLVLNDDQKLRNVITQSDVIKFAYEMLDRLGPKARANLSQLMLGLQPVISVLEDSNVIEAFKLMQSMRVSGVAVVNDNGSVVGCVSASDVRLVLRRPQMMQSLYTPIKEFIRLTHQANDHIVASVVSVTLSDTLGVVITKLVENRIHRVFIVTDDEHKRLIGCVSIRDVLQAMLRHM